MSTPYVGVVVTGFAGFPGSVRAYASEGSGSRLDRRSTRVAGLGLDAVIATALSLTGLHAPSTFGAYALARNTLGCIGLVTSAAVLLGARLAWLPAFGYVCAVYAAAPRHTGVLVALWAWPIQPSTTAASWLTAVTIFALGAAAYTRCGSRAPTGHRHGPRR